MADSKENYKWDLGSEDFNPPTLRSDQHVTSPRKIQWRQKGEFMIAESDVGIDPLTLQSDWLVTSPYPAIR